MHMWVLHKPVNTLLFPSRAESVLLKATGSADSSVSALTPSDLGVITLKTKTWTLKSGSLGKRGNRTERKLQFNI